MKFGNQVSFNFRVNSLNYEGMHRDRDCDGKWAVTFTLGSKFTLDSIGPIDVPVIPLVTCHKCQTSYEVSGFRRFIESIVAKHLVESKQSLDKKQIKFLRLYLDLTQEEFAKNIGLADKHEMSKVESPSSSRTLDIDKQVRLKLFGAKMLKIRDAKKLYALNEIDDSVATKITASLFPATEKELRSIAS